MILASPLETTSGGAGGSAPGGYIPPDSYIPPATGGETWVQTPLPPPLYAPTEPPPTLNPNPGPVGGSPPPVAPPSPADNCSTCVEPSASGGPIVTGSPTTGGPILTDTGAESCEVCLWVRSRPWWWWLIALVVVYLIARKG